MICSPSAFITSWVSVAHHCTKTDGASIGRSVFSSDLFVQVFALVLLLRNSCCCSKRTRSSPACAHGSLLPREDECSDHVTVHTYNISLGLDFCYWVDKIMPMITFSSDLIPAFVSRCHPGTPVKADESRDLSDLVQWKKTLFAFAWSDDLAAPSSEQHFWPCVCSSRIRLRPTVSSSFPSVRLWWTVGVGPSAVFVFGVFSVSEPLLCYRNVPSGQGRK